MDIPTGKPMKWEDSMLKDILNDSIFTKQNFQDTLKVQTEQLINQADEAVLQHIKECLVNKRLLTKTHSAYEWQRVLRLIQIDHSGKYAYLGQFKPVDLFYLYRSGPETVNEGYTWKMIIQQSFKDL